MSKLNWLEWVVVVLVIVGAINWGLAALGWNLVDMLLGAGSMAAKVVYILVGLAGIWMIFTTKKLTKTM